MLLVNIIIIIISILVVIIIIIISSSSSSILVISTLHYLKIVSISFESPFEVPPSPIVSPPFDVYVYSKNIYIYI